MNDKDKADLEILSQPKTFAAYQLPMFLTPNRNQNFEGLVVSTARRWTLRNMKCIDRICLSQHSQRMNLPDQV